MATNESKSTMRTGGCHCGDVRYEVMVDTSTASSCNWRCHVHCFGKGHLAVLGGDFVSINLNTLDDFDPSQAKMVYGRPPRQLGRGIAFNSMACSVVSNRRIAPSILTVCLVLIEASHCSTSNLSSEVSSADTLGRYAFAIGLP